MYFKCSVCKKDSWVQVNPTTEATYDGSDIIFPSVVIDKSKIKWSCKCFKNKHMVSASCCNKSKDHDSP